MNNKTNSLKQAQKPLVARDPYGILEFVQMDDLRLDKKISKQIPSNNAYIWVNNLIGFSSPHLNCMVSVSNQNLRCCYSGRAGYAKNERKGERYDPDAPKQLGGHACGQEAQATKPKAGCSSGNHNSINNIHARREVKAQAVVNNSNATPEEKDHSPKYYFSEERWLFRKTGPKRWRYGCLSPIADVDKLQMQMRCLLDLVVYDQYYRNYPHTLKLDINACKQRNLNTRGMRPKALFRQTVTRQKPECKMPMEKWGCGRTMADTDFFRWSNPQAKDLQSSCLRMIVSTFMKRPSSSFLFWFSENTLGAQRQQHLPYSANPDPVTCATFGALYSRANKEGLRRLTDNPLYHNRFQQIPAIGISQFKRVLPTRRTQPESHAYQTKHIDLRKKELAEELDLRLTIMPARTRGESATPSHNQQSIASPAVRTVCQLDCYSRFSLPTLSTFDQPTFTYLK